MNLITLEEEIYLVFQNWGFSSVHSSTISQSSLIRMYVKEYRYLSHPKGLNCLGEDPRGQTDCLKQEVGRKLIEARLECLPAQLKIFLPNMTKVNGTGAIAQCTVQ